MIWRRKQSLVFPKMQLWLALENLLLFFGFCTLAAYMLFMPPLSQLFGDPDVSWVLDALLNVIYSKWPLVMLASVVLVGFGILLSHRLAGPLFGLARVLQRWQAGDRTARVHFRKYDYLLPLLKPLNEHFNRQEQINNACVQLLDSLPREQLTPVQQAAFDQCQALLVKKGE